MQLTHHHRTTPAVMAATAAGLMPGVAALLRYAGDVPGKLGERAGEGGFWTNVCCDSAAA